MRFELGCRLRYEVAAPSVFVLNVEPARLDQQRVLRETLTITPDAPVERYVMPESGNRYVRFRADPGELEVAYDAIVELAIHAADPASVPEIATGELPFEVLPHLYPSRYCQADRLPRAAQADFGGLEPGHLRVTGICNWIYEQMASPCAVRWVSRRATPALTLGGSTRRTFTACSRPGWVDAGGGSTRPGRPP
jgi:hypothetical protein